MATINFSFQPGMSLQQMIGFEIAGRVWGVYLKDPITVNIHVGTSNSLPSSILGGALPGFKAGVAHQDFEVSGLRTYLEEDDTSSDDQSALNTTKNRAHYAQFNQYNSLGQIASKQWVDGTSVSLTRANAKSLGIPLDHEAVLGGYIVINNNVRNAAGQVVPWNHSYASTTVPTNTIDFVSVDKLLLGGLQFEQLSIQQKGQDTLISGRAAPIMLLKNLDVTSLTFSNTVIRI